MSTSSSHISVANSEGVPDSLLGSRSDTFSIELEGFNRLDVFNLGTINVYDETDGGNDSDDIEASSLSSSTSEDEVGASVVSFESHSDEGFVSRQNPQMHCGSMLMHNRGRDDSLGLLSMSSTTSCDTQIIYRPPMRNTLFNPPHTSSNSVDAPGPSDSLDVHCDKEASSIESTSIGVSPVHSVHNSAGKIEITLEIGCRSEVEKLQYKDPHTLCLILKIPLQCCIFAYLEVILNKCM